MEVRSIFEAVDTDGSGTLDTDEFLRLGQAFNPTWSKERVGELFIEIDRNNDGVVSENEFLAFMGLFSQSVTPILLEKGVQAMRAMAKIIKTDWVVPGIAA